jgi:hypothetical protein
MQDVVPAMQDINPAMTVMAPAIPGVIPVAPGVIPVMPGVIPGTPGVIPGPGAAVAAFVPPLPVLPPASVDFTSKVWNDFEGTVMPYLGGVAQEAVRTNKDPMNIGKFDSVKIQNEILDGTYSEYICFLLTIHNSIPHGKKLKSHKTLKLDF